MVHVRHRLGRRAQLHRVRAAAGRLHDACLRGRDRSSGARHGLEDRRGVRRDRGLHVAHGRAAADALRGRAGEEMRSLLAGEGRVRGRGPERSGLGLAAEPDARGARAGHRPHVADGDRGPGVRKPLRARDAADQAGLGGHPAARHHVRRRGAGRRAVRRGREGDHGHPAALPGIDAHALGRKGALRGGLLGADPRGLLHGRLGALG